jgi:putative ATPase
MKSNPPSLFESFETAARDKVKPLAARMRPRSLAEYVGQRHLVGDGELLARMIRARRLGSIILHGPPGSGKTTLAGLLAVETGSEMRSLSAVTSGVKEVREAIAWAEDLVARGDRPPLLFVDEIHRFNRAQQDALLPDGGDVVIGGCDDEQSVFRDQWGAVVAESALRAANAQRGRSDGGDPSGIGRF